MSVDLVPEWTIGDLCLTSYPFGVDADSTVDIGEPEMVVESVTSMLADGDLERVVRHGNRTYAIPFYAMGATLGELAEAEALLRTELQKTGLTLTHNPGDGFTPASVYEVQTAQLTPERADDHESHLIRKFTLTLTCAPFARSLEPTVVSPLPSGSTTVSIDSCDSTTGWSSTRAGSAATVVNWVAGAVGVVELDSLVTSPETWTLTRTGSVDFTSTPYLVAEIRTLSTQQGLRVSASVNGTNLPVLESRMMTDGQAFHRVVFDARLAGGVAPSITFAHTSIAGEPWQGLYVRQVSRTDVAPNLTARQLTRVVDVGGTERTPGSIHIQTASGTGSLGTTIVHTCPEDGSGYSPPLRRWRVAGNGTPVTEAARFSGAYEPLEPNAFVAQVPQSALPPGGYLLVARLWSSPGATVRVSWAAGTIVNSAPQGQMLGETVVDFPVAGVWQIVPLGVLSLPTVRALGPVTQIDIQTSTGDGTSTQIDEAWLFRMDEDCALTIVNNNTANLWLDSPDVSSPVPRVWVGDIGDRSDARHPSTALVAMGTHVLSPGGTALFTAAESDYPSASAQFYGRWHSNAAE